MILAALALITATPASLPAALIVAQPGDKIVLAAGDYPTIVIKARVYAPVLAIDARKARVAGINIDGAGGVTWTGGEISAPGGANGFAAAGYGVRLADAHKVALRNAIITGAKKGLVIDGGSGITVQNVTFTGLREDGIIASRASSVTITSNRFADFRPKPTTCLLASEVSYGLPARDCAARGGAWSDGDHADAVQIRNGMISVRITKNVINGPMQGIGQMDATSDAPLSRVSIADNQVATGAYHSITLGACTGCSITGNAIANLTPGRKSPIRAQPGTKVCGNTGIAGAEAMKPC